MIKIFLTRSILTLSLLTAISSDAQPLDQLSSTEKKESTMLDRWNEIKRQIALPARALTTPTQPRKVKRYAKPEIIIKEESIFFDGKILELGLPLTSWKNILGRNPHCDETEIEWCVWEELGLQVYVSGKNKIGVDTVIIKLSIPERLLKEKKILYPDGTPYKSPKADWLARHPFTGYLEIDGFGIDKETKFSDFQASIDARRNMRCGLKNCEFPTGSFGPGSVIDLHLNGGNESATIEEIKIYKISY